MVNKNTVHVAGSEGDQGLANIVAFLENVNIPKVKNILVWNFHGSGEQGKKPEDVVPADMLDAADTLIFKLWAFPTPSFESTPHVALFCGDPISLPAGSFIASGSQADGFDIRLKDDKVPANKRLTVNGHDYAWQIKNTIYVCFDLPHYSTNIEMFLDGILTKFYGVASEWEKMAQKLFESRLGKTLLEGLKRDREQLQSHMNELTGMRDTTNRDYLQRIIDYANQIEAVSLDIAMWEIRSKKRATEIDEHVKEILAMKCLRDLRNDKGTLVWDIHSQEMMGLPLPMYSVRTDSQGHVSAAPIPSASVATHPHVSGTGGSVCFGNQSGTVAGLLVNGDYLSFLNLMLRVLRTYSLDGGPYHRMGDCARGLASYWTKNGSTDKALKTAAFWNHAYNKGNITRVNGPKATIDPWQEGEKPSRGYITPAGEDCGKETGMGYCATWEESTKKHIEDELEVIE